MSNVEVENSRLENVSPLTNGWLHDDDFHSLYTVHDLQATHLCPAHQLFGRIGILWGATGTMGCLGEGSSSNYIRTGDLFLHWKENRERHWRLFLDGKQCWQSSPRRLASAGVWFSGSSAGCARQMVYLTTCQRMFSTAPSPFFKLSTITASRVVPCLRTFRRDPVMVYGRQPCVWFNVPPNTTAI